MRELIVKMLFLGGWALALVHSTEIDLTKHLTRHTYLRFHGAEFHAPGFRMADLDRDISNHSLLAKTLRDSGYQLRAFFEQWPSFLFAESSPKNPNKRNLALRSEVASEFLGRNSEKVQRLQAIYTAGHAKRFSKVLGFHAVVMLIPAKIFANNINVRASQGYAWSLRTYGIDDHSKFIGSKYLQTLVEQRIRSAGVDLISLLPLYDRLKQDSSKPLYPYGDSHWSQKTIEDAGPYIVSELVRQDIIPHSCFAPIKNWPALTERTYFGDLFRASRLPEEVDSPYATESYEDRSERLQAASALPECPAILLAGTSYSVHTPGRNLARVLKAVYHGPVHNYSIGGQGPFASVKALEKDRDMWSSNSILLWEFPFHFISGTELLKGPK